MIAAGAAIRTDSVFGTNQGFGLHRDASEEVMSSDDGVVTVPSRHSVDEIVWRAEDILRAKGVKLFALIDHSGEAAAPSPRMRPTKLLIFGSPRAGTPLMLAAPSVALDLPLKLLVREGGQGQTWISYNTPAYLQARHGLSATLAKPLASVEALVAKAGAEE
jgi:uncharacterized protein (DUF302 family)